ncbi:MULTISPECIES: RluA family pseudouridine synthase [Clostridium]|uniref:Pseudouridine synthase n=1 Tax=Clostridium cadaveris TaxID=1529 RepID=A0A1I2JAC6_9CLOT|nr:RluA family pseudouridine synthase [Clostridium cadaveris]MDU4951463.1 RluA family pseudouridine synthase [Clostridium sp.]MDY4948065.1 RluA family pseudouridine synthase [Clostridium cadaveris]NME63190.1 RluA family pseudouridine synthase [Clostridium cadaveris]NWK10272.1 RluA family pseudouridine synthase [Clostridium cadaveris]PWL52745.1 MAG: RluA family pseudouridine synthase [Clostridium cadaveris]
MENFKFEILEEDNGKRIDKYLSSLLDGKSRSYIQRVIDDGKVNVNGKIVKSNYKLKIKDIINLEIPEPTELEVIPENIPLDILYEDKDVIVVNKSQGMVVHPAPGSYNGTMVNALLYHCKDLSGINGVIRPGIVHRIDKDTSGILVVAKNDNSHNILAEQLKDHSMTREYYALVEGIIKEDEGTINEPLARHPKERIKISVVKGGREAITHFKVIERFKEYTLVKCILETGRTHQIRVHMAYIGHPLVGDPVYGYKKQKFKLQGQMLHAKVLGFIHPSTKEYMQFESPLPDYFTEIINKLKSSSL